MTNDPIAIAVRKFAGAEVVAQWDEIFSGPDADVDAHNRADDLADELAEEYAGLIALGYGYEVWCAGALWASSRVDSEFNLLPVA